MTTATINPPSSRRVLSVYEVWRDMPERDLWREYLAGGRTDDELRNVLLARYEACLRVTAMKMSKRLGYSVAADDLFQFAWLGLVDAARTYDPERGTAFMTLAGMRVRGAMLDGVRDQDWVPRLVRAAEKQLIAQRDRLRQELNHEPSEDELLVAGVNVAALRIPKAADVDFENGNAYNDESTLKNMFALACGPIAGRQSDGTDQFFREMMRGLTLDEQTIVYLWLVHDQTMKAIGRLLNICESRVSQIVKDVLVRLRKQLSADQAYSLLRA